jgi:hypothetical protein
MLCMLVLGLWVSAPAALAKGGDQGGRREARVSGTCSAGATSKLRLESRDGRISLEFEVRQRRGPGLTWRVVLVHERRVEWRGSSSARGSGASFQIRRSLVDLDGPDQVTARASGPNGITCEASATLPG